MAYSGRALYPWLVRDIVVILMSTKLTSGSIKHASIPGKGTPPLSGEPLDGNAILSHSRKYISIEQIAGIALAAKRDICDAINVKDCIHLGLWRMMTIHGYRSSDEKMSCCYRITMETVLKCGTGFLGGAPSNSRAGPNGSSQRCRG